MRSQPLAVFAIGASRGFGKQVTAHLGIDLSRHEEREFEDGEHKIRPLVNVRQHDVFVIHSLYSDHDQTVNDKLCRLIFFIGALKDASAARVTAVLPYLAYSRKDRRSQRRDPLTNRYVAQMLESVGTDHVVTLDVHNLAAYQNAFRIPADHLDTVNVFVDYFRQILHAKDVAVLSPDIGGIKRAERFREALQRATERDIPLGFMEKARARGVMTPGRIIGDVDGRSVIILDDMISTGGTLVHAAAACKGLGAEHVTAAATHGVFTSHAGCTLSAPSIDQVVVTDTVRPVRLDPGFVESRLTILPLAGLFAEAIKRLHSGDSLVELLDR
jgi:ribose-phosphate pyrophosphokinase